MTIIKHKNQRVGVFLDVQNLYHCARSLHNKKVNFESVVKHIVQDRSLIRAIAYVTKTETGEESAFFEALVSKGIETKSKDLQIFSDNTKKADWDVGLSIDMVTLAPKLDVVVLVSGDGDFVPALEYIQKLGCQIEVAAFERTCSYKLIDIAEDFIDISSSQRKFLI